MKVILLAAVAAILIVLPVSAQPQKASIAIDSQSAADVVYAVSLNTGPGPKVKNPYSVWVAQKCYLNGELVDAQYLPLDVPSGLAGTFVTSGVHVGSEGETPWTSDTCSAYAWEFPDSEDPISNIVAVP
jgi:hypothetical protein